MKDLLSLAVGGAFPLTSLDMHAYDGGHLHYFAYKNVESLLRGHGFIELRSPGVIPTRKLAWLRPYSARPLVRDFFSAGLLVRAR